MRNQGRMHIDCAVAAQLIGAFCFAIYVWSVYMIARITLSGNMQAAMCPTCSGTNGCQGPRPLGPKEIDGLLVSPGKAYTLLSDYWLLLAHLSRRLTGELIVYPCSGVRPSSSVRPSVRRPSVVRPSSTISKIFSSETAWPIKAKLHVEHP